MNWSGFTWIREMGGGGLFSWMLELSAVIAERYCEPWNKWEGFVG